MSNQKVSNEVFNAFRFDERILVSKPEAKVKTQNSEFSGKVQKINKSTKLVKN